jgi:hypothetical protein
MHSTTRATQPVCVISVSSWLEKTNCARTEIVLPPGKSFAKWPANTVAHAQGRVKRINNLQQLPDALHDTRTRERFSGFLVKAHSESVTKVHDDGSRPLSNRASNLYKSLITILSALAYSDVRPVAVLYV